MRYLITDNTREPFFTDWFDYPDKWADNIGMIVFDLYKDLYTTDGHTWKEIIYDHL